MEEIRLERYRRWQSEYDEAAEMLACIDRIFAKIRRHTHVKHECDLLVLPGFKFLWDLREDLKEEIVSFEIAMRVAQILYSKEGFKSDRHL